MGLRSDEDSCGRGGRIDEGAYGAAGGAGHSSGKGMQATSPHDLVDFKATSIVKSMLLYTASGNKMTLSRPRVVPRRGIINVSPVCGRNRPYTRYGCNGSSSHSSHVKTCSGACWRLNTRGT